MISLSIHLLAELGVYSIPVFAGILALGSCDFRFGVCIALIDGSKLTGRTRPY